MLLISLAIITGLSAHNLWFEPMIFLHPNIYDKTVSFRVPEGKHRVNVFKVSKSIPHFDAWLIDDNGLSANSPVKMSTVFDALFGEHVDPDENGDTCMGYFNTAEICMQSSFCVEGEETDIGLPLPWAGEYVVDLFEIESVPLGCPRVSIQGSRTVAPLMKATLSNILPNHILSARNHTILLEFADEVSAWWARSHGIIERMSGSWLEMMRRAFDLATPGGQILEFGVASGRSLSHLASLVAGHSSWRNTTVVGFDSFRGLPQAWGKYQTALFNMGGIPPLELFRHSNIDLKFGLFSDTVPLIRRDLNVSILHIDSDLYESALEVLKATACLLVPGSIVVFDELFNLRGTYGENEVKWWLTGEYRALNEVSAMFGIQWEPIGFYYEQAVPIRILQGPREHEECHKIDSQMKLARLDSAKIEERKALQGLTGLLKSLGVNGEFRDALDAVETLRAKASR